MKTKIFIKEPITDIGINLNTSEIIIKTENNKIVLEINWTESFKRFIQTIKMVDKWELPK